MSVLPSPAIGEPPIQLANDIQLLGAIFAFLLGLAFGSFLNVVLTRLPNNESIVTPASHCRNCTHTLSWWENIPLLSWITLRGRCHQCQTRISLRYPLIELAVAILWVLCWLHFGKPLYAPQLFVGIPYALTHCLVLLVGFGLLSWLLLTLSVLDAEHFWLPDALTIPGVGIGFAFALLKNATDWYFDNKVSTVQVAQNRLIAILAAAAIILIIRLLYWLIRRKEGMGLGDAKLMAMLGAWLSLIGALETFAIAILTATAAALIWLLLLAIRENSKEWAKLPLPLGTFLCLAALPEIFYPNWLWNWYAHTFLP